MSPRERVPLVRYWKLKRIERYRFLRKGLQSRPFRTIPALPAYGKAFHSPINTIAQTNGIAYGTAKKNQ